MKIHHPYLAWVCAAALTGGLLACLHKPDQWSPELLYVDAATPVTGPDGSVSMPGQSVIDGGLAMIGGDRGDAPADRGATQSTDSTPSADRTSDPTQPDAPPASPDVATPSRVAWDLVSVGVRGVPANSGSRSVALSGDGRYVFFSSDASNLVEGDTNNAIDIFRFDRQTKTMVRVNVAGDGTEANAATRPDVSVTNDGRLVIFVSSASNLVPNDTNADEDVFLRDLSTGAMTRVSTTSTNAQISGQSATAAIAAAGRYAAFNSNADGVLPGAETSFIQAYFKDLSTGSLKLMSSGTQSAGDLWMSADGSTVAYLAADSTSREAVFYLYDVVTQTTARIASLGAENGSDVSASFSADGRLFAFDSWKDPMTDMPATHAVYLLSRPSGVITRLSAKPDGTPGNQDSYGGYISADGRFVGFSTLATNLAPGGVGRLEPCILDRQSGSILRVPGGNGTTFTASLSADGKIIAVSSSSSDLVAGDTNGHQDIFVAPVPPP